MEIRIDCLVGARPNFVKMAAIYRALTENGCFVPRLIHSGQHYSPEMSSVFFEQLELPIPDVNLDIGPGTHTEQSAECMRRLEPILVEDKPQILIVVGDVNSTLAGALVAAKTGVAIAHVEAGLRSFDRRMPEEINRVVTDAISEYLFVTERGAIANLLAEGICADRIFFVGNVMIDTLLRFRGRAEETRAVRRFGLNSGDYLLATLHRPSNVDDPRQLAELVEMLDVLGRRLPVVFPVHPRTRSRLQSAGLDSSRIIFVPPLSYLDFICLLSHARLTLTDSGGIQEETTILGTPCLTLRENTERPVTIEQGTNRLAGIEPRKILEMALDALDHPPTGTAAPELWDGKAASRVVEILAEKLVPASKQAVV